MITGSMPAKQRGATLVVGLIMLLLLTLMVGSAFTLSTTNLKAVGNMQVREEAIAAANAAIELVISSAFIDATKDESIEIDINNNGITDYTVNVAKPQCVGFTLAASTAASSVTLGTMSDSTWDTLWEITATVNDVSSGASATVRQGIRVRLGNAQKTNLCS
ncbi:PilX N-terminal domain-containing pilus assembly protein [Pseudomonas jilinensis]|nr:PilX N-terminal domain-containing pilus assembly protein [Pseudomonas jilinensis]